MVYFVGHHGEERWRREYAEYTEYPEYREYATVCVYRAL